MIYFAKLIIIDSYPSLCCSQKEELCYTIASTQDSFTIKIRPSECERHLIPVLR